MEISRILIMFIVILIMWKDTLSYQTRRGNHMLKRSRRNHESDTLTRINNVRETKKEPTEILNPTNVGPRVQNRPSNLGRVPAKSIIPPRSITKIRTLYVRNTKNIDNTKPDILLSNPSLIDKKNEVNETLRILGSETKEVEEKKLVVDVVDVGDSMTIDKKLSIDSEENSYKESEKSIEETVKSKSEEPQIVKPKIKSKSKKREFKTRKPYEEKIDEEKIKTTNTTLNVIDTSLKRANGENKHNAENQVDNKISGDVLIEQEQEIKSVKTENMVIPQQDESKPPKHTFLEVIQNDYHISSPLTINKNDSNDEVSLSKSGNNEYFETSTFDSNSIDKLSQTKENNGEDEGVVVKKNNFEEDREITRSPKVPICYQLNTVQNNINKDPTYDYNYQVPYDNYDGIPAADLLNNNNPYAENKLRIDEIDGSTVVSYNNYFKMPGTYSNWNNNWNPNYPSYNLNNYGNYGNQGYGRPSSNICNNDKQASDIIKDRVWRSWQNTEFYLKSKNALKQVGNEKLYNVVNQNNAADKSKYIVRPNALRSNDYYRNLNTSPYS